MTRARPSDAANSEVTELRAAVWLASLGTTLGRGGAVGATRVLGSLLFGVNSIDGRTFLVVTVGLTAVAFVASYLPARRAARVDPMVALRDG